MNYNVAPKAFHFRIELCWVVSSVAVAAHQNSLTKDSPSDLPSN